jgi:hypothetical protein
MLQEYCGAFFAPVSVAKFRDSLPLVCKVIIGNDTKLDSHLSEASQ